MKKLVRVIVGAIYAFSSASIVEIWGISYAYKERGYCAVGGEYFLFPITFLITYKIMQLMFRLLDEEWKGWKR